MSATVVSELLVKIGADIAGLKRDMDDARDAVESGSSNLSKVANLAKNALVGLAGAISVGAFTKMVNEVANATGALNDLSSKTGASAAALERFRLLGATSDTDIGTITGAMNKLSKSMADAGADGGKVGVAIKALGLDFTTFKQLKPEEQMIAVAKAMNNFEDGAGKSAAALAIYPKSGADLIPFLKDVAENADSITESLTEQQVELVKTRAALADAYGDNLTVINQNTNVWKRDLTNGLLPVMAEVTGALASMTSETGYVGGAIKGLAEDGTLASWARGAVTALSYVVDVIQGIASIIPIVGTAIAGLLAATVTAFGAAFDAMSAFKAGDFSGAWTAIKGGFEGVKEVGKAAGQDIADIWNQKLIGETFRDTMSGLGKIDTAGTATKGKLDFSAEADANAAALKKQNDELDKFTAGIKAQQAGLSSDYFDTMTKLQSAYKAGKLTQEEYNTAVGDLITKQPVVKAQAEAQKKAQEDLDKSYAAVAAASSKYDKALIDETESMRKSNVELKDQNEKAGLNTTQLAAREAALLRQQAEEKEWAASMHDEGTGSNWQLKEQARLLRERADMVENNAVVKEAKAAAEEWAKTTKSIEDDLVSAFMNGVDGIKDYFKNAFKDFVANVVIRPIMAPIAGAMNSIFSGNAMAGTGGAGGGGGFSQLFSTGMDFLSGNTLNGVGLNIVNSGLGQSLGLSSMQNIGGNMIAGPSGLGSMVSSGLGMAGNAFAGYGIGKALSTGISGGYSVSSGYNKFQDVGMAVASALGGPVMGAIVGAATGLINRAFGRKAKELKDAGIEGTITGGDATGQRYQEWFQKGGWFRSNKSGTDRSELGDDLSAALDLGARGVLDQTKVWAAALKLPADALAQVSFDFKTKLTGNAEEDKDAIELIFQGYQNKLTDKFKDVLTPFQHAGETLADTMQRLVALSDVSDTLNNLGGVFSNIATSSIDARENIIALAGGIDQLMAKAGAFVQDYYSAEEQVGLSAKQILGQLQDAGIGFNDEQIEELSSKADFRALLESIDANTENGQKQIVALLNVAPQFAKLADYAQQFKNAQEKDLQTLEGYLEKEQAKKDPNEERVLNLQNSIATMEERLSDPLTLMEMAGRAPETAILDSLLPEAQNTTDAVTDVTAAIKTGNDTLTAIKTAISDGNVSIATGLAALATATQNVATLQAQIAANTAAAAAAAGANAADASLADSQPTYSYDIGGNNFVVRTG